MASRNLRTCAGCGHAYEGEPAVFARSAYCCEGCRGGECTCAAVESPRIVLEAGPFSDQADLLLFAALLETAPGLSRIALMSAQPRAARFEVFADSADAVAAAVGALPGYSATLDRAGSVVRARIAPSLMTEARTGDEAVVPTRTRFRVVRGSAASDTALVLRSVRETPEG